MARYGIPLLFLLLALMAHGYRLQYNDPVGAKRAYKTTASLTLDMSSASAMMKPMKTVTTREQTIVETAGAADAGGVRITVAELAGKATTLRQGATTPTAEDVPATTLTFLRLPGGQRNDKVRAGAPPMPLFLENVCERDYGRDFGFPEKDLKVGDTWTREFRMQDIAGGQVPAEATYTITGEQQHNGKPCLVIQMTLSCEVKGIKAKLDADGEQTEDLSWKAVAASVWDPAAGELVSCNTRTIVRMVVSTTSAVFKQPLVITETYDYTYTMVRTAVPATGTATPDPKATAAARDNNLGVLRNALEVFRTDMGVYPTTLLDLCATREADIAAATRAQAGYRREGWAWQFLKMREGTIPGTDLPANPLKAGSPKLEDHWRYAAAQGGQTFTLEATP